MIKRFFGYFLLSCILVATIFTAEVITGNVYLGIGQQVVFEQADQHKMTILLLPLDSRPPCTQFVEQLGAIAGFKIIMPPAEILDNYKSPADRMALQQWLRQNIHQADAAIISVDMLIHGGLLASRHAYGSEQDQEKAIHFLTELHKDVPHIPIHVFNIIPRLLIADTEETMRFQKSMAQYSTLKDQFAIFENPTDIQKLYDLEKNIPPALIEKYQYLYTQNRDLNIQLINMTKLGIFAGLVIGQDDGQVFGWPSSIKRNLQKQLTNSPELKNKVFVTRGTDEVALTILGKIAVDYVNERPKIYVAYSQPHAAQTVMPFMPHTVQQTVSEKIELIKGVQVNDPDKADFILYVHIGNRMTKDRALIKASQELTALLEKDYKIALVDLTEDFYASETLLSLLLKQKADLTQLVGYAGWNTTSNSIGTAITQAAIFTQSLKKTISPSASREMVKNNLEFLIARYLDDWYYQKNIQPSINQRLLYTDIDPYNLGSAYCKTDQLIQDAMADQARHLFNQSLSLRPIDVSFDGTKQKVIITDLQIISHLPWQRTFEIYVRPSLSMAYWEEKKSGD
ncbi:MAG: DUF4127 family protein [Negativicutes bacterium]